MPTLVLINHDIPSYHHYQIISGYKTRLYLHLMPSIFHSTENSQMLHPKGHMEFIVRLCCAHWWQHVKLWCRRCVAGVNRWLCWMVPHKLSAAIGYQSIERQWQRKLSRKTTQQHVLRLIRCKPAMSHQPHTRFFLFKWFIDIWSPSLLSLLDLSVPINLANITFCKRLENLYEFFFLVKISLFLFNHFAPSLFSQSNFNLGFKTKQLFF